MEQKFYKKLTKSGAVTIPRTIRSELGLYPGDSVEIDVTEAGNIVIGRHRPGCICCGNTVDVIRQGDKYICGKCVRDLAEKYNADRFVEQPGQTRLEESE